MSDSRIILPYGNGSGGDEECGGECGGCGGCSGDNQVSTAGTEFKPGDVVMSKLTGQKLMVLEVGQNKVGNMMYVVRANDFQAHQLFDFEVSAIKPAQEIDKQDIP
jgi:hypothetical protein